MKLIVLILGLSVLMLSPVYAQEEHKEHQHGAQQPSHTAEDIQKGKFCPVCGPEEKMEELSLSYKHKGQKYSFCSMDCLKAFKKNPEKYIMK